MKTISVVILFTVILGIIFLMLSPMAYNGYGYYGYWGFGRGASWWYLPDGGDFYTERNSRSGSIGGANQIGGGPGSGK